MRTPAFLTVLGVSSAVVASATVALAAGPPIATFGPISAPNGSATGSGAVGSGGQADACLNDRHSGANPSSSDTNGAAQLNDRACQPAAQSSGGAQTAGSSTTGSPSGSRASRGRATSASTGRASSKVRMTPVMATQAFGLRIASIRFATRGVKASRQLGVIVTVRDRRGFLVRDAIVSIGGVRGSQSTIAFKQAVYSNRLGQATFRLPVKQQMGGKRLLVAVSAHTPTVHTRRLGAVRLPTLTATKA